MIFSEERTSSTHALTMFRYNYTMSNKTYKVGKFLKHISDVYHTNYPSKSRWHKLIELHLLWTDIWDTAGQESFNELHPTYYFGAHVCIMVFDVTRKVTYTNLRNWYGEMRN